MNRSLPLGFFTALLALSVFLSPMRRDLYVGDETKYAQILREMQASGSYFVPVLGGNPYTHKPPLHFWMMYGLTALIGQDRLWGYVLPSILGFLAMLLIVRRLAREIFDDNEGWLASFLFGSLYLIWGLAQTARMDLEFTACISIAALYVFRTLRKREGKYLIPAAVAVGIGILFKGPMAFVIVLLLLVGEMVRRGLRPRAPYFRALAIAAAIPLLWVVPAVLLEGPRYARELLIRQNIGRAVGSWVHRQPVWFYLERFPLTFFPWFLLFIFSVVSIFTRNLDDRERQGLRFCSTWFLAVLVPFSLISGKLDIYMVPAAVPLSLIASRFIREDVQDALSRLATAGNAVVTLLIGAGAGALLLLAPGLVKENADYALVLHPSVSLLLWITVTVAVLASLSTIFIRQRRLLRSTLALGATAMAPLLYVSLCLLPLANRFGSTEPLIAALQRQNVEGSEIALFKAPYLWSREMPPGFAAIQYIGGDEDLSQRVGTSPTIIAAQQNRVHLLGTDLIQNYEKVDEIRMRGKPYDIYRKRRDER